MDKLDIIDIAQEIDTYETSILHMKIVVRYSCHLVKTKPKLEKVEFYESFKDFDEIIKEAVENREVMSFPIKKTNEFENLL